MSVTVKEVVAQLNTVPVFGILTKDGKLYSTEECGCMVYTMLDDVHRVLAQLQRVYPSEPLQLYPLELGTVLSESGVLVKKAHPCPQVTLVASPEAKQAAQALCAREAVAHDAGDAPVPAQSSWRRRLLASVPIFHVGTVTLSDPSEEEAGELWPLFFQPDDVDVLWKELGAADTPCPPVQVINLAELVGILRDPAAAKGKPLVCAPLDSVKYMREHEAKAMREGANMQQQSESGVAGESTLSSE